MKEGYILMLEFFSILLFSLEYFLYKKQINYLEKVFIKKLRKLRKDTEKSAKYSKNILQKESKIKKVFFILFLFFILYILYQMYQMHFFLGSKIYIPIVLTIIIITYLILIAPMKNYDYYASAFSLLALKLSTKCLYTVKKGVIVGLGFFILMIAFLGKFFNIMNWQYPIIEQFSLLLVGLSMLFVGLIYSSYQEIRYNSKT